jgi:hypothetical protein
MIERNAMVLTSRRTMDPMAEAAALVERRAWDSRRAMLIEGSSVTVLIAPRRHGRAGFADVWITVVPKTGGAEGLDQAAVTLASGRSCRYGRLRPQGRCVIREVPDDRHRLGLSRLAAVGQVNDPDLLPVSSQFLGDWPSWTSADGILTMRRLSGWRKIMVEADKSEDGRDVSVGLVVGNHLEVRSAHLGSDGGSRACATVEFTDRGRPAVVCLPLVDPTTQP